MGFWFNSSAIYKGYMYWLTEIDGAFMRLNLKSKKAEYLIPNNKKMMPNLSSGNVLLILNGVIYGFAQGGDYFYAYDLENNYCKTVYFGKKKEILHCIANCKAMGDFIYFVASYSNYVYRLNIKDAILETICQIEDEGKKTSLEYINAVTFDDMASEELSFFSIRNNRIYTVKIGDNSVKYFDINVKRLFYSAKRDKDGKWYLLSSNNELFSWDSNVLNELCGLKDEESCLFFTVRNNIVWFLPFLGTDIKCFNINEKRWQTFSNYPEGFTYDNPNTANWGKYGLYSSDETYEYFAMHCGNDIFSIDEHGNGAFVRTAFPENEEQTSYLIRSKEFLVEKEHIGLSDYIGGIIHSY